MLTYSTRQTQDGKTENGWFDASSNAWLSSSVWKPGKRNGDKVLVNSQTNQFLPVSGGVNDIKTFKTAAPQSAKASPRPMADEGGHITGFVDKRTGRPVASDLWATRLASENKPAATKLSGLRPMMDESGHIAGFADPSTREQFTTKQVLREGAAGNRAGAAVKNSPLVKMAAKAAPYAIPIGAAMLAPEVLAATPFLAEAGPVATALANALAGGAGYGAGRAITDESQSGLGSFARNVAEGAGSELALGAIGKGLTSGLSKASELASKGLGKAARVEAKRALKWTPVPTKKTGTFARESARGRGEEAIETFLREKIPLKSGEQSEAIVSNKLTENHQKVLDIIDNLSKETIAKRKAVDVKPLNVAREAANEKSRTIRSGLSDLKSKQKAYADAQREYSKALATTPAVTSPKMWKNHLQYLQRQAEARKDELDAVQDAVKLAREGFTSANKAKAVEQMKVNRQLKSIGIDTRKIANDLNSIVKENYSALPPEEREPFVRSIEELKQRMASGGTITPKEAQEMKHQYQSLAAKFYNKDIPESDVKHQAQVVFASGLRRELEDMYPQLKELNEQSSAYYGLLDYIKKVMDSHEKYSGAIPITPTALSRIISTSPNTKAKLAHALESANKSAAERAIKLATKQISPQATRMASSSALTAGEAPSSRRRSWGQEEAE